MNLFHNFDCARYLPPLEFPGTVPSEDATLVTAIGL